MTTAIVYRKLPDIPHRQYVKRIVAGQWVVWHREKCAALRARQGPIVALGCGMFGGMRSMNGHPVDTAGKT